MPLSSAYPRWVEQEGTEDAVKVIPQSRGESAFLAKVREEIVRLENADDLAIVAPKAKGKAKPVKGLVSVWDLNRLDPVKVTTALTVVGFLLFGNRPSTPVVRGYLSAAFEAADQSLDDQKVIGPKGKPVGKAWWSARENWSRKRLINEAYSHDQKVVVKRYNSEGKYLGWNRRAIQVPGPAAQV